MTQQITLDGHLLINVPQSDFFATLLRKVVCNLVPEQCANCTVQSSVQTFKLDQCDYGVIPFRLVSAIPIYLFFILAKKNFCKKQRIRW